MSKKSPPDLAGGLHVAEHLEGRLLGELPGQYRLLHVASNPEFVLHGNESVPGSQGFAQRHQVLARLVDRDAQVREVDGLGDEVERPAIHRGTDVLHVSVRGHDDGADVRIHARNLFQERQSVHARHVDVGKDHVDVTVLGEHLERFDAIVGECQLEPAGPDIAAKPLPHQVFEVRLVVDDQDLALGFRARRRLIARFAGLAHIRSVDTRNLLETANADSRSIRRGNCAGGRCGSGGAVCATPWPRSGGSARG